MTPRRRARGQPLVALVLILGGWIGVRAMLWDSPLFMPGTLRVTASADRAPLPVAKAPAPRRDSTDETAQGSPLAKQPARTPDSLPSLRPWPGPPPDRPALLPQATPAAPRPFFSPPVAAPVAGPGDVSVGVAAAHQMMRIVVLQSPFPMAMALPIPVPIAVAAAPSPQRQAAPGRASRWSGEGWLLLRKGGNVSLVSGPAPAAYGASQAGAVLRYRLAPASGHRPAAYLRGTATLNGSRDKQAALGLAVRPFARVPVTVQAELRAADRRGRTRLRPAVMAVTELPPVELPYRLRAEAYAQAGYVGGRGATAFADGQLRVDRRIVAFDRGELRAGAGAWGGAEKGTNRLDVGPTATLGMELGQSATARVAVDWRFRVTGDARPASGPALTLSAGF